MKIQELKFEMVERMLKDEDWRVRTAAMNACQGRDVPLELIEKGLKDEDYDVRTAAMNACQGRDVPLIRTFEPPKKVYKKCVDNVIVVAKIPKDAQVRGSIEGKCRANKAVIIDVEGDLYGEKVGISIYDQKTVYKIGDHVEIKDFDLSLEECSTGFHFFCDIEKARKYEL